MSDVRPITIRASEKLHALLAADVARGKSRREAGKEDSTATTVAMRLMQLAHEHYQLPLVQRIGRPRKDWRTEITAAAAELSLGSQRALAQVLPNCESLAALKAVDWGILYGSTANAELTEFLSRT